MNYRIFTSFAIEDKSLRDFLVGQKKNSITPFNFVDMSVKEPWSSSWKTNCRTKIKGCDGMIVILTHNTIKADGQLWEIKCAQEEGVPIYGIRGYREDHSISLPYGYSSITIHEWTWDNIANWLKTLRTYNW